MFGAAERSAISTDQVGTSCLFFGMIVTARNDGIEIWIRGTLTAVLGLELRVCLGIGFGLGLGLG